MALPGLKKFHQEAMSPPDKLTSQPLRGRVALVTGSARGLGSTLAREFAADGADVAVHYRHSETEAANVAQQIRIAGRRAETFRADLAHTDEARALVRQVVETFGQLDCLVYNVGPFLTEPFLSLSETDWDFILNTNLKAAWVMAVEAAPALRRTGSGRIIHIGANSALVRTHSVYGLAKAALVHLTESLAVELGPHVTVNCIAPGMIEGSEPDEATRQAVLSRTPTGKLVTAEEIAKMCVSLCHPDSGSITGRTIVMDGGRWLR
ncbi:MAG: SDR family oxidoreductase [Armatimonadota bacterium]|nr:SDR family oxidoreductase [Armatimonadota bacterium]